ncbi:fructuronate reductase [Photobacterium lutimaris]|uniref:Fructuronate reductase n=1 Tax=Photobacterium lutimaris TaxID=388278 RepID=A0A2T3J3H1_9GAMM|nr:fructuronate reductase [Photobacterium lutimaris]PSU35840.1 fructuronate reductase [Photobacterium lutimaris]TDR78912.1 fructuronate reductase [Photobacterium lutimaris]
MDNIANSNVNTHVIRPNYDRSTLKSRIVHLGFGAFHRAHQALFTNEMLEKTGSDWGICEINLFGGEELITQLREQEHLYTVAEKGASETIVKMIGSVTESLHPNFDGQRAVLEKMAEEQVAIVSMTITEKGYCADPATGRLDKNNSLIKADLENPREPKSAIGYIVEALRIRRELGLKPFTVMSCDNVQENGHVARAAVLDFANLVDQELAGWIEANVTFPCTMVDRIVPAATPETLAEITERVGVADPCGIACEPFRQWVIEDNFVNGRPEWDVAGAEFVTDVVPFEEMKLRMLNGSHSFLAYLGYLGGYQHISDTMTNESYRKAAFDMMMLAQAPTLTMPEGTDLDAYAKLLIERFTNPSLKHQTWQIAMDGSQKIPQRMGGSLRHHLAAGSDYKWLAMGIAGWMIYISGVDEKANPIDVRDPMVEQFKAIYQEHGINTSVVKAILGIEAIFGTDLIKNNEIVEAVTKAYQLIITKGARAAVASL